MLKDSHTSRALGPFFVFIAAMLWATDAPFRAFLTDSLPSLFIVLSENAISALILLPFLFLGWKEYKKLNLKEWGAVFIIAVGGSALAIFAFTEAFRYVNPSVAILLQKLQPLVAISFAAIFLKETLSRGFWLWAFVAIGGAYLISFPHITPRLFEGEVFNPNTLGVLLALTATVLWGASTVFGKYVLRTLSYRSLAAIRFTGAFIFLFFLALYQGSIPSLSEVSATDWLFIGIIAITSGVVSLFIYYFGLKSTKASVATIAELGFPLAAVFINALFIVEINQPGTILGLFPLQWLGTILLLFAIYRLSVVNQKLEQG